VQLVEPGALDDRAVWELACTRRVVSVLTSAATPPPLLDLPVVDDTERGIPLLLRYFGRQVRYSAMMWTVSHVHVVVTLCCATRCRWCFSQACRLYELRTWSPVDAPAPQSAEELQLDAVVDVVLPVVQDPQDFPVAAAVPMKRFAKPRRRGLSAGRPRREQLQRDRVWTGGVPIPGARADDDDDRGRGRRRRPASAAADSDAGDDEDAKLLAAEHRDTCRRNTRSCSPTGRHRVSGRADDEQRPPTFYGMAAKCVLVVVSRAARACRCLV
jgi:hypothetical protein